MIRVEMERNNGDFGFEIKDSMGHVLETDSSSDSGGKDSGFRPMQLLLAGLGSCSAIDMVSILQKQRQTISHFKIVIEGEREHGVIPSLWTNINMHFHLSGNIDHDKASRAAQLSVEKYCSVAETLRRAGATIKWTLDIIPS